MSYLSDATLRRNSRSAIFVGVGGLWTDATHDPNSTACAAGVHTTQIHKVHGGVPAEACSEKCHPHRYLSETVTTKFPFPDAAGVHQRAIAELKQRCKKARGLSQRWGY